MTSVQKCNKWTEDVMCDVPDTCNSVYKTLADVIYIGIHTHTHTLLSLSLSLYSVSDNCWGFYLGMFIKHFEISQEIPFVLFKSSYFYAPPHTCTKTQTINKVAMLYSVHIKYIAADTKVWLFLHLTAYHFSYPV